MEWKTVKLGDVCDLIAGFAFKAGDFGDYPQKVVKIGDINPPYVTYASMSGIDLSKYDVKKLEKFKVQYGDYVLAMTGATIGKVGKYIDSAFSYLNQRVLMFKPKPEVDAQFVNYVVCSAYFRQYVMNHIDSESAQPNISATTIGKYEFPLPPLETQRRIAAILSSLDCKIENNNRINRNLEAQAQALFKSWFVDFEPWGGVMPEDWREGTLEDIIANIESGSRPQGGAEAYGIPSVGAEKIERFGYYEYASEKYVNNEYFAKMKRGHVKDGDVLLYKDGAYTGKTSMALDGFPYETCAVNEHVFLLRTESSKHQFFLYFLMSYPDIRKMIHTLASAKAAQPGLNQSEVLGVDIIVPSKDKIEEFNRLVAPSMHLIAAKAKESQRLATLRDTLLPKLMKGEIAL